MSFVAGLLAIEIANERRRETERHQLALRAVAEARAGRRRSSVRRTTALGFAAISRASAAAVRRLDDCLADDLGRSLARDGQA